VHELYIIIINNIFILYYEQKRHEEAWLIYYTTRIFVLVFWSTTFYMPHLMKLSLNLRDASIRNNFIMGAGVMGRSTLKEKEVASVQNYLI
jgi:hypothetical protein